MATSATPRYCDTRPMASGVRPATETEAGGLPAAGVGVGGFGVAGDEKPWGAGAAGRDGRLGPACEVGGFGALGSRSGAWVGRGGVGAAV